MVPAVTAVDVVVASFLLAALLPGLAVGYLLARAFRLPAKLAVMATPYGVDRWAALPPTVLFVAGVGWLTTTDALPGGDLPLVDTLLLGVALFGAVALAVGLGTLGRYRRLAGGRAVGGPARPATDGGTAPSPLGGRPVLAWSVQVRERTRLGRGGPWPPVHEESGGTVAVVQGATEQRRVDVAAAAVDLRPSLYTDLADSWFVGPAEAEADSLPERVVAFRQDRGLAAHERKRVYEEVVVEPGDEVTLIEPDGATPTVVSGSLDEVRVRSRRRVWGGVVGVGCLVVGVLAVGVRNGAVGL